MQSELPTDDAQTGLRPRWDFLTNHAHVLLCISHDPGIRLRDIAARVGITERTAHKILSELIDEGYVKRERQGRRNHYAVESEQALPHPLVKDRRVGELIDVLAPGSESSAAPSRSAGKGS